jgi:hypothetical protein
MPQEVQEEADARQYMDELQTIVDALSKQLAEFDAQAKKGDAGAGVRARPAGFAAIAHRAPEPAGRLSGMRGNSSALNALTRRAQAISNERPGLRIVADIGQRPHDQAAELEAIRNSVSQPALAANRPGAPAAAVRPDRPVPQLAKS